MNDASNPQELPQSLADRFKNRKVVIGFPSPDLIDVHFHNALMQLVTQTSRFVPLGLTNAISSRITANRNAIIVQARQLGATDILWIDSDSFFPVNALMTLLMHDKDIACATTCRRVGNDRSPVAIPLDFASVTPYQKLVPMRHVGLPFMLTKMTVFDRLDELGLVKDQCYFAEPPRWMMKEEGWITDSPDPLVGEDEYFCKLVLDAGFDIWCDMELSMQIGHVGSKIYYIENPEPPKATVDEALA